LLSDSASSLLPKHNTTAPLMGLGVGPACWVDVSAWGCDPSEGVEGQRTERNGLEENKSINIAFYHFFFRLLACFTKC
jgi:hypothetical protein